MGGGELEKYLKDVKVFVVQHYLPMTTHHEFWRLKSFCEHDRNSPLDRMVVMLEPWS